LGALLRASQGTSGLADAFAALCSRRLSSRRRPRAALLQADRQRLHPPAQRVRREQHARVDAQGVPCRDLPPEEGSDGAGVAGERVPLARGQAREAKRADVASAFQEGEERNKVDAAVFRGDRYVCMN
jgi:hypothetical protein